MVRVRVRVRPTQIASDCSSLVQAQDKRYWSINKNKQPCSFRIFYLTMR